MAASRRPHRALAVLVHCLGVLAALPALPEAADPVPRRDAAPPVRVDVAAADTPTPAYRIVVHNDGDRPVETTVRQELPPGSSATTISGGGRAGGSDPGSITWQVRLPAHGTVTLTSALDSAGNGPLTAPACAFASDGTRPYDCATATWRHRVTSAHGAETAPAWRRPGTVLGGLAAVLLLVAGSWRLGRRSRRPKRRPATGEEPGRLHPRPATPPPGQHRRRPPVWLVVGGAAAVLAGVLGAAAWTATARVAAIDTDQRPTSGAWTGQGASGSIGVPLREATFEFTVYRVACTGPDENRRCQATVGVRNLTPEQQRWHAQLQRAYLPGGGWVHADELATRAANRGRDVFAEPLGANDRVLLPLVFRIQGAQQPRQLELRSGVFSAGVRVDVG